MILEGRTHLSNEFLRYFQRAEIPVIEYKLYSTTSINNIAEYIKHLHSFLKVIERAGAERVQSLGLRWVGLPLVSKQKDDFYNQHEIENGWLVVTHSGTN